MNICDIDIIDISILLIRILGICVLIYIIKGVVKNFKNDDIPLFIDCGTDYEFNFWGILKPLIIGCVYMFILGVLYIFISI